jgi:aquaporin Z
MQSELDSRAIIGPEHRLPHFAHLSTSIPPSPSGDLPTSGRLFRDRRALPRPEPGGAHSAEAELSVVDALRRHWPEYAIEGGFLFVFVLLAGVIAAWLQPAGAGNEILHRALSGVLVGGLLIAMIYSPWGRRSGSHLNPAITLAYLRLGKVGRWDGLFYIVAQLAGSLAAVLLLRAGALLPPAASPASLAVTLGPSNPWLAFATQFVLSTLAMLLILFTSNHASFFRWTGLVYGALVMLVVACVSPLAGFGMNAARLLAVDASGDLGLLRWLNLLPPLLGMQLAIEVYRLSTGRSQVLCAKLAHNTHGRCIFRCMHPYQTRALAMEAIKRRTGQRD